MRGLLRGLLACVLGGFDGRGAGLIGVLPEVAVKERGGVLLDLVAALRPIGGGVERQVAALEAGVKLFLGDAVGDSGLVDDFGVCHGKNLL